MSPVGGPTRIIVQSGVPTAPPRPGRPKGRQPKYPFAKMAVGDSFVVATNLIETAVIIQRRLTASAAYHRPKKFSTRHVNGGVRCWRIS